MHSGDPLREVKTLRRSGKICRLTYNTLECFAVGDHWVREVSHCADTSRGRFPSPPVLRRRAAITASALGKRRGPHWRVGLR